MVAILPTTEELDVALARANAIYAERHPLIGFEWFPGGSFEGWCRWHEYLRNVGGPTLDANVIGLADAKLLADGFDFAMQHQLHWPARAHRVGFAP